METIFLIKTKKEMFYGNSWNYIRNKVKKFLNPFFDISFNLIYLYLYLCVCIYIYIYSWTVIVTVHQTVLQQNHSVYCLLLAEKKFTHGKSNSPSVIPAFSWRIQGFLRSIKGTLSFILQQVWFSSCLGLVWEKHTRQKLHL